MAVLTDEPVTTPEGESRDLGFGSVVASERKRLLNRDGSFNVRRSGLGFWQSSSLYHTLLTMSWARFLTLIVFAYIALNALFAVAYTMCGAGGIDGDASHVMSAYAQAFFFSVQTFGTIGYGHEYPVSVLANTLVAIESLFGLLGFALATGIMFARFSRPLAQVKFSRRAVVAPYHDKTAFMFRIANQRSNELIEVEARIVLSMFVEINGTATRRFSTLKLERAKVAFLPLSWTIVHPIDEESPLWGLSEADYASYGVEFLVLLTAIDETFSQTVHARMSYSFEEVQWNARFSDIFGRTQDAATLTVDISRIDAIESAVN
jgi:inward rectifier potassium channel